MTRADKVALALSLLMLIGLYSHLWRDLGPVDHVTIATGQVTQVFSIDRDQRIVVDGLRGQSMIEVRDGRARFVASPCYGKVCVHAGWLEQAGDAAACVPNGVIVSLAGSNQRYDSINF